MKVKCLVPYVSCHNFFSLFVCFYFILLLVSLCVATAETVEHRGGDKSGSCLPGPQQNLQTQAGNLS